MDYITRQHGYNEPKHKDTITFVYNHVCTLLYIVNQSVTTFLPFKSYQDKIYWEVYEHKLMSAVVSLRQRDYSLWLI